MNEKKLISFSVLTRFQLADYVSKVGFKNAMKMRREVQVALAKWSQKGPQGARLPIMAQQNIIERIQWVEKWCRHYFLYHRVKELANSQGGSLLQRKRAARAEWEQEIIPTYTY